MKLRECKKEGGIAFQFGDHVGKTQTDVSLARQGDSRCWALLGQDAASLRCSGFRTSQNQWKVLHALNMCH